MLIRCRFKAHFGWVTSNIISKGFNSRSTMVFLITRDIMHLGKQKRYGSVEAKTPSAIKCMLTNRQGRICHFKKKILIKSFVCTKSHKKGY